MQLEKAISELIYGVGEAILTARLEGIKREEKGVVKQASLRAKNVAVHYAIKKLIEFNKTFTRSEG